MLLVFGTTLFVSATLLFLIQPMVAKMILPLLGGTPAVWNTCMVFFQALLLGGYAYAHAAPARLGARRQVILHVALLLVPFLVLPIAVSKGFLPPVGSNPVPWLLWLLLVSVGIPFFVVSATAPLLQRWFAGTGHRAAGDPYFLYAASNVGSMLGLLGYPLLVEPHLRLQQQSQAWAFAYGLLAALIGLCAVLTLRSARSGGASSGPTGDPLPPGGSPIGRTDPPAREGDVDAGRGVAGAPRRFDRLRWMALAFVPSSLMLGVTTYLTTDIAAIPLFWVLPLALYLATFTLAFAGALRGLRSDIRVWLSALVLWILFSILIRADFQPWVGIPLHLTAFFLAALVCHGELAESRPDSRHLTEFYLWMSLGGVLGGLFNVLVAPRVFHSVVEYPLALGLTFLFLPDRSRRGGARLIQVGDVALAAALGLATVVLMFAVPTTGWQPDWVGAAIPYGLALLASFLFVQRPARFALSICAIVLAVTLVGGRRDNRLHQERSFFGVLSVTRDKEGRFNQLFHGNTLHGMQNLDPALRDEPLTYFHRKGPIGQVFAAFDGPDAKARVAVIGLGTGSIASYGEPDQRMTFYEIDPAVLRIARDPRWFTFLRDSRADVDVVLGDARLRLAEAPDGRFGLIVLDAFSSDAIPVHLITREAIRLYLAKLEPGGLLVAHISNRYLDLEPVLGGLARDAGLAARIEYDSVATRDGKKGSIWVVMARQEPDLGPLAGDARWRVPRQGSGLTVWTDDFSNLVSVMMWTGKRGRARPEPVRPGGIESQGQGTAGRPGGPKS